MHVWKNVFAMTVVGACFLGAPGAKAGESPESGSARARLSGTFKFAGSAAEEASRRAAIDRAVDSLFFAVRGIARSRLSDGTKIEPWVKIAFEPGRIRVRVPSSPEAIARDDGTPVDYVDGSERSKLSERLDGNKLVQRFVTDEGQRINEWLPSADGTTATLRVTVASPKLSAPVIYSLTYKKS